MTGKEGNSPFTSRHHPIKLMFLGIVALFRISGVPPFLGFYAKACLLKGIIRAGGLFSSFVLLWGALSFVFIYLRLGLS